MSFILDALRKSESERQRDAGASLSRAPLAIVRQRTPVWSWFLIGLLSVALLAITAVWWRSDRGNPATGTGGSGSQAAVVGNAVSESAAFENPGGGDRAAGNRATPLTSPAPGATTSGTTAPPTAPASLIPPRIRPARELAALDPNLPPLRLELLAYNGRDPAGGSAWINGQRYFVGDLVANGPELVEVLPDGVILAYGGQRFLLATR